jgi:hypothetical protein
MEGYILKEDNIDRRVKTNESSEINRLTQEFLKTGEVEHVPGPCSTVAEVLEGNRVEANLNKTISHKPYGSF